MFINISNIPYRRMQGEKQKTEAMRFGTIVDIDFPYIDPRSEDDMLEEILSDIKQKIKKFKPKNGDCVCIAGEYGITFRIIDYVRGCLNYITCCYPDSR